MTRPAHPRSRGENEGRAPDRQDRPGSSPLTRGKPPGDLMLCQPHRLIPAHAGKTPCSRAPSASPPAHPRSRGENDEYAPPPLTLDGSSPLTRGKRSRAWSPIPTPGLIPAHAGKTLTGMVADTDAGAHPRSRGENSRWRRPARSTRGSSPLTRGKRALLVAAMKSPRLIPAHAGKTPDYPRTPGQPWAHPRSRGENSPQTRSMASTVWLIPAHAGKTFFVLTR